MLRVSQNLSCKSSPNELSNNIKKAKTTSIDDFRFITISNNILCFGKYCSVRH